MTIVFVTGNKDKWAIAQNVLSKYSLDLVQEKIETPEIQSTDVSEIAKYSARYASNYLQKPIIKTDVGYYIDELHGFPGPFVKYINQWLSPDQILLLLQGKTERKVRIVECLAFCEPGKEPITFISETFGRIAEKADGTGSTFDQLLVRDGFDNVQGLCAPEEILEYWSKNLTHFHELGKYLQNHI